MIKRTIAAIAFGFFMLFAGAAPVSAAADPGGGTTPTGCNAGGIAGFLGFRAWDACLEHDANGVPQIKALEDIWKIALIIVEFFIKISGYLAVGFMIWGGIKYLKSQGEPGELTQARQIITNALLGLVICMISVAIVQFVAGIF